MKTVHDLSENELSELKENLFHQMMDDGSMDNIMGSLITDSSEIPDSLVKSHFEDTFFVEEDFFCNILI